MHVLVTEANFGDSERLILRLRELGVRVTACHERTGFCRALKPGAGCPLDDTTDVVDAVVDVRGHGDELTVREYGVICAERTNRPTWIVPAEPDQPAVIPAAVRGRARLATEAEFLVKCQRRHPSLRPDEQP